MKQKITNYIILADVSFISKILASKFLFEDKQIQYAQIIKMLKKLIQIYFG